jgi:FKBP-type peptidyl-prolyl cis-trans isomerase
VRRASVLTSIVPTSTSRAVLTAITAVVVVLGVSIPAAAQADTAADPLANVTVVGAFGKAPKLKFAKPFTIKTSVHTVRTPGTGAALSEGQNVVVDYLVVDGRTGKRVVASYGKTPAKLPLDATKTTPVLVNGLLGAPVGSRVLVAVAPKDGLAKSLNKPGVKKKDTLLFVFDVKAATTPLARATGDPVPPVAGLPTVTLDATGKPTVTVPGGAAPSALVSQVLIKGTGPVVTSGQALTVHYTGLIWATGRQFDSSWDRGQPNQFQIGTGSVIKGWDEGLVGQTVGSQVLLVVPPDKGYGSSGQESAGISGTDTLVFVVDILDAT